jgi:hypothetical protein
VFRGNVKNVNEPVQNGSPFYESVLKRAAAEYPVTTKTVDLHDRLSPLLISPEIVELPHAIAEQAETIVKAFWELRNLQSRQIALLELEPKVERPGNDSILMSYDFHIDKSGDLRLIEINTNASMALVTDLLYKTHELKNRFSDDFSRDLMESFRNEFHLAVAKREPKFIAIVDEAPSKQRMYIEFKMFQEFFKKNGMGCEIADSSELSFDGRNLLFQLTKVDLVYNRDVDFYFAKPATRAIADAAQAHAACVTPHAFEYRLLADKQRLVELSQTDALRNLQISESAKSAISKTLIRSVDIAAFDPTALWNDRKRWFFKPKRLHGGKAVYRGSSTARPAFTQILAGDYLAQEMVPAPVWKTQQETEFKYDLRFFVYRDRIQLSCARLYQGQMTNSQTPGGGIAPIRWI